MSGRYPPNDQDTYDVLPPTGRRPEPPEPQRVIGIISHPHSATVAALAALVAMDYSDIERRVLACMKEGEDDNE